MRFGTAVVLILGRLTRFIGSMAAWNGPKWPGNLSSDLITPHSDGAGFAPSRRSKRKQNKKLRLSVTSGDSKPQQMSITISLSWAVVDAFI
jgi:hypothetical protein